MTEVVDAPPAPAGAGPAPLEAAEFVRLMTVLAAYLFRAGFLLVFVDLQLKVSGTFAGTPDLPQRVDIAPALRGSRRRRERGPVEITAPSPVPQGRWITRLVPGAALSRDLAGGMVRNIRDAALDAVLRSSYRTLRSAVVLFATIVITFFSGDTWKILGTGPLWRILSLDLAFVFVAVVLVARGKGWWRDIARLAGRQDPDLPCADLLEPLWSRGVAGHPEVGWRCTPRVMKAALWFFYVVNIGMYIVFGALWMAFALVVAGMLRIDKAMTVALAGNAHVYAWSTHLPGGMVLTEQLMLVALSLGALAGLYAAVATLQDDNARDRFVDQVLSFPQASFAAYAAYAEAWLDLDRLLGRGAGGGGPAEVPEPVS